MNKVWSQGGSSLYQGNCLEVMKSFPSGTVDCIWTDPPYNLSNDGITCVAGKMVKVNKGEWDRTGGIESDHAFALLWLGECHRLLKEGGTVWVSGTMHSYPSVGFAMQQTGFRMLNDIIWEKSNPPPNLGCRCFTHSTEVLLWAAKGRGHTFNYSDMKTEAGGKQMKNVWRISVSGKAEKKFGKHPTQKPVELIRRCIRASTTKGDLIVDPFAGSSTTGVAALLEERNYIGIELEQEYIDLSLGRLGEIGASRPGRSYQETQSD